MFFCSSDPVSVSVPQPYVVGDQKKTKEKFPNDDAKCVRMKGSNSHAIVQSINDSINLGEIERGREGERVDRTLLVRKLQ